MPSGYRSVNVDFDDLFDPDVQGDGPISSAYRSEGSPLRYAALAYGTKRADVGYRQNGADVSNLWAQKGSAQYALGFNGQAYNATAQAPTGASGNTTAILQLVLNADGTWNIIRQIDGAIAGNGSVTLATGSWLRSGESASDYQVRYVATKQGEGTVTNSASDYVSLTLGRSVSLNVTVPSNSGNRFDGTLTASCDLRKVSSGLVTRSTCTFNCSAMGWQ